MYSTQAGGAHSFSRPYSLLPLGEYITIYQYQRQQIKLRMEEKERQLQLVSREREELKTKLAQVQALFTSFLQEKGAMVPASAVAAIANSAAAAATAAAEAKTASSSSKTSSSASSTSSYVLIEEQQRQQQQEEQHAKAQSQQENGEKTNPSFPHPFRMGRTLRTHEHQCYAESGERLSIDSLPSRKDLSPPLTTYPHICCVTFVTKLPPSLLSCRLDNVY